MIRTLVLNVIANIVILGEGRQKVSSRGKGRPQKKGNCASCGSSTHKRSSHKDCPFHKSRGKEGANTASRTNVLKDMSESDGLMGMSVVMTFQTLRGMRLKVILICVCAEL